MARLVVRDGNVNLELDTREKVAGLHGQMQFPLEAIENVAVLPDPFVGVKGFRAPGLAIPGRVRTGTWRGRGGNTFAVARRGVPAVDVKLKDRKYRHLVISLEDAPATAAKIREAAGLPSPEVAEEGAMFVSDGLRLAGTWARPASAPARALALILPGSGEIDRDADHRRMPLGISRDLAHALALNGIASFRYDKRGVGHSEGSFLAAGFNDNLTDAVAAFGVVSRRREENVPVFVVGHSEGAYHAAALAAAEGTAVDGVVLLSSSAQTGLATSQWQTAQIAEALPVFPRTILRLLRVDLREQQRKSVKKILATTQDVVRMQGRRVNARWMREFLTFDPLPFLASLKMPVLAVTGEKDLQVDPADLDIIARTAPGPVAIHRVPDMSHLLRRDPKSASLTDYKRQVRLPTDPEISALIVNWVGEISRIEETGDRQAGVGTGTTRQP